MASAGKSLRAMVEHWLAPDSHRRVHVTKFRNRRSTHECYVCVETLRVGEPAAMYFFRHRNGMWSIFPPGRERPSFLLGEQQ